MAFRNTADTFSQVSLILMEILHQLGVNERIRCRRKNTWKQFEQLQSFIGTNVRRTDVSQNFYYKIFGSQIEGSTTPGLQSDLDIVHFHTHILATTNMQDAVPGIANFLMVTDKHTPPGYFKLQKLIWTQYGFIPLHRGNINLDDIYDVDCNGRIVINSSRLVTDLGGERHGPAVTESFRLLNIDKIFGIGVNSWLQETIPWLLRTRRSNWISRYRLEKLLKRGIFLVPVGFVESREKDLEFRISFTSVERELMWRVNRTQMACYTLIKIIKKSFIKPIIGECLSSYHCKTALFYLIDNTSEECWKPNKLLFCLKLLLKTICDWVKVGLCPNYFIPQENMFLGKVTGLVRQKLFKILVSLIDMEFKYLVMTDCDQLGQALSNACSRISTLQEMPSDIGHLVKVTRVEIPEFKVETIIATEVNQVFRMGYQDLLKLSGHNVTHGLMFTLIHGFQTGSRHMKDILFVLIRFLSGHIGCQLASSCLASQNFHLEDLDNAHNFLLHGIGSDVTSGKLKLAGFYLKLGYLAHAEAVLSAVEQELVHYVTEISTHYSLDNYLKETTMEKILSENMTTSQIFESCIAASVTYLPSETHITLPPLNYEMLRSVCADPALRDPDKHYWYDWAVVDARPYLYFLQYLTYSALKMFRQRQMSLINLAWSYSNERTIFRDTCLNLLAYCLRQEGALDTALQVLYRSLEIKPDHNAAVWQIDDVLNQLDNS